VMRDADTQITRLVEMTHTPGGRRWRPRTRKIPAPARPRNQPAMTARPRPPPRDWRSAFSPRA
jgi:hypothetical protein